MPRIDRASYCRYLYNHAGLLVSFPTSYPPTVGDILPLFSYKSRHIKKTFLVPSSGALRLIRYNIILQNFSSRSTPFSSVGLLRPIPAYSGLLRPTPAYSGLLRPTPAYSGLLGIHGIGGVVFKCEMHFAYSLLPTTDLWPITPLFEYNRNQK